MSRHTKAFWAIVLCGAMFSAGCKPVAPFYLGEHDDLAHYMDVATKLDYPDVHVESLTETTMTGEPLTLSHPEPRELWDLTLEEALQISLHNSKVLKEIGGIRGTFGGALNPGVNVAIPSENLRRAATVPDQLRTVYDAALQESNVLSTQTQGVESALAEFDAQVNTSLFWDRTNRPENSVAGFLAFPTVLNEDRMVFSSEVNKRTASGSQFFFRNNTVYSEPTDPPARQVPHDWLTNFEVEARQPLARGAGVQVNRAPVVLARIRTDITLADFECAVRDHVRDVENTYWELYYAYRNLEAAKAERDSVHAIWRNAQLGLRGGTRNVREEAQARQQYFESRSLVEGALVDLFQIENRLRFLLGLTPTDCRLIRPIDEPLNARVCFDWHAILCESLARSCELRIKRWQIKQRETELITARNQLLPRVDAVALYRWLGRGEDLLNHDDGPGFAVQPENSDAFEDLFNGDYQEWRLGVEMARPIGFRRELAGVRNAQLALARECALLKETELELVHALTDRIQRVDGFYNVTQTNFNRRVAAENEVRTLQAAYEEGFGEGSETLNLLLDSLRRRAIAQSAFFRTMVNYTVAVSEVHTLKGSLLEYNNILLAEGPWPQKAYYDAMEQARKRAAGHYLDYGYTRPRVISQGDYPQFQHGGHDFHGELLHDGAMPSGEVIETPQPEPAADDASSFQMQMTSAAAPNDGPGSNSDKQPAAQSTLRLITHNDEQAAVKPVTQLARAPSSRRTASSAVRQEKENSDGAAGRTPSEVRDAKFDWGPLRKTNE